MDYFAKAQEQKSQTVQRMFDEVAPKYDKFNAILSLGLDTIWRNIAIKRLLKDLPSDGFIVDMGCGSGDLAGDLHKKHAVIGADFCHGMLKEAKKKFNHLPLSQADATRLPFSSSSIRGLISAFVIRNIDGLPKAFTEFHRCLQPGGKVAILEFSLPTNAIVRFGFLTYLKIMFPIACKIFKGDGEAYEYLRKSIQDFGTKIDVVQHLKDAGFENVSGTPLLFGGVKLYEAQKTKA
jgi:demethylmenaquinone methyltransferase/2-methoxy-6-polyprenyl-1,4-benzoquinol methylase